jgi:hypothetical protein
MINSSFHDLLINLLYWRNIAGNAIAETDASESTTNTSY